MEKKELTVEEAIIAMVRDGETVVSCNGDKWTWNKKRWDFIVHSRYFGSDSARISRLGCYTPLRIKAKPKTRPMTRLEVLEKVANDPSLIASYGGDNWHNAAYHDYSLAIAGYSFAHIKNGEIVGIHKAEVEE